MTRGAMTDRPRKIRPTLTQTYSPFIPRDKIGPVFDAADILLWTTESDADRAKLLGDPDIQQLNATAPNRNVFTSKDLAGAIAFSSPLSLPVVADQLPPLFNDAL